MNIKSAIYLFKRSEEVLRELARLLYEERPFLSSHTLISKGGFVCLFSPLTSGHISRAICKPELSVNSDECIIRSGVEHIDYFLRKYKFLRLIPARYFGIIGEDTWRFKISNGIVSSHEPLEGIRPAYVIEAERDVPGILCIEICDVRNIDLLRVFIAELGGKCFTDWEVGKVRDSSFVDLANKLIDISKISVCNAYADIYARDNPEFVRSRPRYLRIGDIDDAVFNSLISISKHKDSVSKSLGIDVRNSMEGRNLGTVNLRSVASMMYACALLTDTYITSYRNSQTTYV